MTVSSDNANPLPRISHSILVLALAQALLIALAQALLIALALALAIKGKLNDAMVCDTES